MVSIILSNRTDLNIVGLDSLLPIANETFKIDNLILTAGFPFNKFLTPNISFKSVKEKIYQGQWGGGCRANISSNNIYTSYFNVEFNVPSKEDKTIEGDCSLVPYGEDYVISAVGKYNLLQVFSKFGISVDDTLDLTLNNSEVIKYLPDVFLDGVETLGTIRNFMWTIKGLKLSECYIEIKESDDPNFINYDGVKKIINSLQWIALNFAPTYSVIQNNDLWIMKNVNLANPFTSNNIITLNTDNIVKWKETKSKQGYELNSVGGYSTFRDAIDKTNFQDGLDFNIEAIGTGLTYRHDGTFDNHKIKIIKDMGDQPQLNTYFDLIYYASAMGTALYYDGILGKKQLEISTTEVTSIIPYSKVQIENKKYYCIEAKIPYKDYELFEYKLQEMK